MKTEFLLTRPEGFGIEAATPAQRAACRILDGLPLAELRQHPDVLALIGGAEAVAQLPSERSVAPTEAVFLAAIRSAKTIIACCAAIRATQTVEVNRLGPGELARVSLVSLKLDLAAVAHRMLVQTMRNSPVLRKLLIDATADTLLVRHPSGRAIEIAVTAGAKAGGGLTARWSAGVIFDEAPRMGSAADAVVNLADARSSILGRLLPGAQALYIGSPWSPHGDVYDMVQQHWAKPTDHLVVLRGTGPMLNPSWWTPERCAKLQAQDPIAFQTEVCGDFADPEAGLLNPLAVYRATRDGPLELEPERGAEYHAAVDPAEGAARGNAWSCAIVQRIRPEPPEKRYGEPWLRDPGDQSPRYRVVLTREWRGLTPGACWKEVAAVLRAYGIRRAVTDAYAASANVFIARLNGLHLVVDKATQASNLEAYTNLATLLHNDRVELPPDATLRRDLLSIKRRATQQGSTIVLPRTSDGRHADLASALCAAIKSASHPHVPTRAITIRGL